MDKLASQVRQLAPSAKEPLFRRLMVTEELGYLREKNSIIGFEVDMGSEQELSGFALIAIQKHTVYAYCSDLDEPPKLILFPPLDKLFDPAFGMLGLDVIKRRIPNASFSGADLGRGSLKSLVRDLTPPEKKVDIPESVAAQMAGYIKSKSVPVPNEAPKPVELAKEPEPAVAKPVPPVAEEPDVDAGPPDGFDGFGEPGYDGFGEPEYMDYEGFEEPGYMDGPGYMDYGASVPEPEPAEDARSIQLKAQQFGTLSEVGDFCSRKLKVPHELAVTLVNKALQSEVSPEYRVALAVKLFCRLFDEKKI